MHPGIYEALILALLGVSGVGMARLLGHTAVIPMAFVGLGAAVALRIFTTFLTWSTGLTPWLFNIWLVISFAIAIVAWSSRFADWRAMAGATVIFGAGAVTALLTKYFFEAGEKEHTDSAATVALALVVIQSEQPDLSPLSSREAAKRGVAYPIMLALGPEGRIFSAFTPLVFLAILLTVAWIVYQFIPPRTLRWIPPTVAVALGFFSLSVPIFRASMFYINAHTLMAFGLLLITYAAVGLKNGQRFDGPTMALVLIGGTISATARIEGIVLVIVIIAFIMEQRLWKTVGARVRLTLTVASIGGVFSWWLLVLDSTVLREFGIPGWSLILLTAAGSLLSLLVRYRTFRFVLVPAIAMAILGLLVTTVVNSPDPIGLLSTQWPNLVQGQGGWASAALVSGFCLIVLGWRSRSESYRTLISLSVLLIAAIFATKVFDGGGFGRESFFDSVNRMLLHVMPLVLAASSMGFIELLRERFLAKPPESTSPGLTVTWQTRASSRERK